MLGAEIPVMRRRRYENFTPEEFVSKRARGGGRYESVQSDDVAEQGKWSGGGRDVRCDGRAREDTTSHAARLCHATRRFAVYFQDSSLTIYPNITSAYMSTLFSLHLVV